MKFGIIGDLHAKYDNKRYILQSLSNIYETFKDIDIFVLLGDIFDNLHSEAISYLKLATDIFEIVSQKNTIIIVGNHDIYSQNINALKVFQGNSKIRVIDGLDLLNIKINKYNLLFVPFVQKEYIDTLKNILIKKINRLKNIILFTHYDYKDLETMGILDHPKILSIYSGHLHNITDTFPEKYVAIGNIINTNFANTNRISTQWGILEFTPRNYTFKTVKNMCTPIYLNYILSISKFLNININNKSDVIEFLKTNYPEESQKQEFLEYLSQRELVDINLKLTLLTDKTKKISNLMEVYNKSFKLMQYLNKVHIDFQEYSNSLFENSLINNNISLNDYKNISIEQHILEFAKNTYTEEKDLHKLITLFKEIKNGKEKI